MPDNRLTMPYLVAFYTMAPPNPNRLGTSEEQVAQAMVWAQNADEAIAEVRRLCAEANRQYVATVEVSVPSTGIAREVILNDDRCTVSMKDLDAAHGGPPASPKRKGR